MRLRQNLSTNLLLTLSMVLLVLGIYSYPAVKTAAATHSFALPPLSAADATLYLNISAIHANGSGQVVDPYYGMPIAVARMGYLKFRLGFLLFAALNSLLHGHLFWTLLLWNLFWWTVTCIVTVWFFQQFLPDHSIAIVLTGLAILMLFNFGNLQGELAGWTHFPSVQRLQSVQLPLIRPFFPQLAVPLLILYLGLQMKALQTKKSWFWFGMLVIQFLAFVTFPYATLMMAGITAVAALGLRRVFRQISPPWGTLLFYAGACALSDVLFLIRGNQVTRSGAPGQYSLIHLQLSVVPHRMGGVWLMLAALTALVFLVRGLAPEIKWPLIGLGVSTGLLLIGDAFFSETTLQMSHHAGYFVHTAAAILFVFLLSALSKQWLEGSQIRKIAAGAAIAILALNGSLIAHATYWGSLPANQESAELARALKSDPPQANDLVIAHSLSVDDDCAWVPLLSSSHPLFCRNAQVLLSPDQNQQVQRFRQALYLHFTGRNRVWVEHVLDDPTAVTELTRLMFLGQVTTDAAERAKGVAAVRNELLPWLDRLQDKDPEVQTFFSRYRRVLVVDSAVNRTFEPSRLAVYLHLQTQRTSGNIRVSTYRPAEN